MPTLAGRRQTCATTCGRRYKLSIANGPGAAAELDHFRAFEMGPEISVGADEPL
jgi:hypothetical protein